MKKANLLLLPALLMTGCIVYQPRPASDFGYTYDTALPIMDAPPAPAIGLSHAPAAVGPTAIVAEKLTDPPRTPPIYSDLPTPQPATISEPQPVVVKPQEQIIRESAGTQPIIQESPDVVVPPGNAAIVPVVPAAPGVVVDDVVAPDLIADDVTRDLHITNNVVVTNNFASRPLTNEPAGAQRTNQNFGTNAPLIRSNQNFGTNPPVIRSNQFFNTNTSPRSAVSPQLRTNSVNEPAGAANSTTLQSSQRFNFSPAAGEASAPSQTAVSSQQPLQQQQTIQQQQIQQQQAVEAQQQPAQNPSPQPPADSTQSEGTAPQSRQLHKTQPAPAPPPQ